LDKFVWDRYTLTVLPGTPPGDYQVSVGLYTLADGARVPIWANGQIVGDSFILPVMIHVRAGPVNVAALPMQQASLTLAGSTLLGYVLEADHVPAPGFVRLTLFWRADRAAPPQPRQVEIILRDAQGKTAATLQSAPAGGFYPPAQWPPGQIVRDIYSLWVDAARAPGSYTLHARIDDHDLDIGPITIEK
jgi:hypothetical protein